MRYGVLFSFVLGIFATYGVSAFAGGARTAFGPDVTVGDIVHGFTPEVCEAAVSASPLPGRTKTVNRREIIAAVRRAGGNPDTLRIPTRVRVSRPGKTAKASELRARIETAIRAVLPQGIVLEEIGVVSDMEVPKLGYTVTARWTGDENFRRRTAIPVEFLSDGGRFRSENISVLLSWESAVPTAVRDLRPGELVSERDIEWKKVRLSSDVSGTVKDRGDVVGRLVQSPVAAGEPFRTADLKAVPVVHEGERLKLESVFGLVRVSALAVARQDGAVGDRVRVITLTQKRLVWARVLGPGRATVVP